jgi:hypothetical protein
MKFILKTVLIFCCILTVSCSYSKSRVYVDKETGGYNDVTIVISSELKASDCPRILEDIKVKIGFKLESLFKVSINSVH